MDFSDVNARVHVAFSPINILVRHSVEFSPSTVSLAKELRYCILFVVIGVTSASIVRSVLTWKTTAARDRSESAPGR